MRLKIRRKNQKGSNDLKSHDFNKLLNQARKDNDHFKNIQNVFSKLQVNYNRNKNKK